jgi:cytochrome c peroxidase
MQIHFRKRHILALLAISLAVYSCRKEAESKGPVPYKLSIPSGLPAMAIPETNPLTEEGIELGRRLFYDPILSGNNAMSCGTCHKQQFAFTDSTLRFSIGVDGLPGTRNTMSLVNLGYQKKFFWDGGAADIESQVIDPIQNPLEMHETLPRMIEKLNGHPEYPALFEKVFGNRTITTPMVMKAIAQFERTLISGNSKFDQFKRGLASLSDQEKRGMAIFEAEERGDCVHCHTLGSTFSDFEFRNTGLDSIAADAGRYRITLLATDSGKFKTPSLRNIDVTAPYMHDGRFRTLEECVDHYNTNFHYTKYLDGNIVRLQKGRLNAQEKADLVAFLHTLTDHEFLSNPKFGPPRH